MKFLGVIALGLSLCLWSCDKSPAPVPPDLGHDFFPLEMGSFIVYKADSIYHDHPVADIPGIHDTTSFYIKEVIQEEFIDAENKEGVRIMRYARQNDEDEWEIKNVWYARLNTNNAERVEENRRYVKLSFPITSKATWDANALNDLKEWRCSYDSLYREITLGDLTFVPTITVNQHKYLTEVNDEFAYEIYARDIGLIYRHHKVLFTRPSYLNNRTAKNIISGYEYKWQIVEYGME